MVNSRQRSFFWNLNSRWRTMKYKPSWPSLNPIPLLPKNSHKSRSSLTKVTPSLWNFMRSWWRARKRSRDCKLSSISIKKMSHIYRSMSNKRLITNGSKKRSKSWRANWTNLPWSTSKISLTRPMISKICITRMMIYNIRLMIFNINVTIFKSSLIPKDLKTRM